MTAAALVVSLVALVISASALWYARRQATAAERSALAADASARSSETLAEVETARFDLERAERSAVEAAAKRADVRVQLMPAERNAGAKIRVTNRGPSRATGLQLIYDAPLSPGEPPITLKWRELPETLEAGASGQVVAGLTGATVKGFSVIVEWVDGDGSHKRTFTLGR